MMRYAPALGSHFCQTLSAVVVCPSLDISTELIPDELSSHLTTGDERLKVQRLKLSEALDENSSLSYGASPAIWDHTVLPATRHK